MDENTRYTHGIFISYKRKHKHLAGRIYDYFHAHGVDPFMDEHSMGMVKNYEETLLMRIRRAPYFLCLLTPEGLRDLCLPWRKNKMFYKEVKQALDTGSDILIVTYGLKNSFYSRRLPIELQSLSKVKTLSMPDNTNAQFFHLMDDLMKEINQEKLHGVISWREYTKQNANVRLLKRDILEKTTASLDSRFGKDLMACIEADQPFTGENHVKEINLSCYAASIIFTPGREVVDRKAYDLAKMFKVFRTLLYDPDFSLRLVINAPDAPAVEDAKRYRRLGNNKFDQHPEGVFLCAYAGIQNLLKEEPFKTALAERRFDLTLSDCAMPFSVFQVLYKNGWEEFNHVKIDLYSVDLDANVDRRSMLIFEKDDKENYDFFVHQFSYLHNKDQAQTNGRIRENNEKWLKAWEDLKSKL